MCVCVCVCVCVGSLLCRVVLGVILVLKNIELYTKVFLLLHDCQCSMSLRCGACGLVCCMCLRHFLVKLTCIYIIFQ